ncbi:MAG TPA: hypothetical protein VGD55_11380 [Acidothermaceae bacterium]
MRHRIRIQPYIPPELYRKLRAYSAVHDLTDSAVAEAALSEYLGRDEIEEGLMLRRVTGVDSAITRLQQDVDVLSQTLVALAQYALASAPPVVSPDDARKARRLFAEVLARAAKEMDAGVRLAGLLDRARSAQSHADPATRGER